ncbi:MAG TPA: NAD-dependent epimerase/dehydratase family protein [Acidimicrobiia bacterium]|nr:NAD-dependent epimerase/dehydratase family protein [Acidimicrobiia bacterium]
MKVLFTGATGVLGREAVPLLIADGHDVTAIARSEADAGWLDGVGARPLEADLFDSDSVGMAVNGVDAIVHFATAIPPLDRFAKPRAWALNDRLRDEATALLVDAASTAGVSRFVQQSVTFAYADGGDMWLDETDAIDPGFEVLDSALAAEAHVDRFRARGGTGVTLRLSRLYGPGRASSEYVSAVAAGKVPLIGSGQNYVSSLHVVDGANAVLAALAAPGGTYNVSDDEPVTAEAYVTELARLLGARKPRRVPSLLARVVVGRAAELLTRSHRVSNRKLIEASSWRPRFPSVTEGWKDIVDGIGSR